MLRSRQRNQNKNKMYTIDAGGKPTTQFPLARFLERLESKYKLIFV